MQAIIHYLLECIFIRLHAVSLFHTYDLDIFRDESFASLFLYVFQVSGNKEFRLPNAYIHARVHACHFKKHQNFGE